MFAKVYDFKDEKKQYVNRCLRELKNHHDFLEDLYRLDNKTLESFREKYGLITSQFNKRDVQCVAHCKKIIRMIIKKHVIVPTDENLDMISKLMTKRYVLKNNTCKRVTCYIYVDDQYQLYINRYNYHKNNDKIKYTFVSGCIEINEQHEKALLREMREEVNIRYPLERYTLTSVTDNAYNYCLHLSTDEFNEYVNKFNASNLDPEITQIVLMEKLIY